MSDQTKNLGQRVSNLEKAVHELKSIHTPRQQYETAVGPQDHPTQEHATTQGKMPLGAHISPTPYAKEKTKHRWYRPFEWWKSRLEIIAIFAGVGYAFVTYFQWRDLHHNFEVDQRAWIKVDYGPVTSTPVVPIRMKFTNVGKSPALRISIDVVVETVQSKMGPSFVPAQKHTEAISALLFPNDSPIDLLAELFNDSNGSARALTEAEVQSLVDGKSYLAIYGQVIYADQFGVHWTHFCSWKAYSTAKYEARSCIMWNAVGDGNPPQK